MGRAGLGRSSLSRGAVWGVAAFLLVSVALVVAALVPTTRPLFEDQRAANVTGAAVAYQALIRIPLGTVVLEEVAFRGVLLALFAKVTSTGAAVAWSSALFGLWHVVPTVEALRANRMTPSALAVMAAAVATAAGGALLASTPQSKPRRPCPWPRRYQQRGSRRRRVGAPYRGAPIAVARRWRY